MIHFRLVSIIDGALKFRDMQVQEVMTPISRVFMLSCEEKLNAAVRNIVIIYLYIVEIFKSKSYKYHYFHGRNMNILISEITSFLTSNINIFISISFSFSFQTLSRIFQSGYSSIPVFDKDHNDVLGILKTKDLIFVDPNVSTAILI